MLASSVSLIDKVADDRPLPWVLDADYRAIRTDRYKLIHWVQHPEYDELYDLKLDPREDRNMVNEPGWGAWRKRALLERECPETFTLT